MAFVRLATHEIQELAESRGEFVADAAEGGELFFVRPVGVSGISDAPVNSPSARKNRAEFGGGIANGDDRVEVLTLEFTDRF